MQDEDVAHIVVHAGRDDVSRAVDKCLQARGYRRVALKGQRHLADQVDWTSPFEPPPKKRCLMLLPEQGGWTTVVDETDRLDIELARCLSSDAVVIAVQGYFELSQYGYVVFDRGALLEGDEIPDVTRQTLEVIRENPDHVTRFPYDEICLRLPERLETGTIDYVGYSL